jgi:hypothetical protein
MMNDFFSNLIDRSFDRTPVLERRRPSRFEPVRETRAWQPVTEIDETYEAAPAPRSAAAPLVSSPEPAARLQATAESDRSDPRRGPEQTAETTTPEMRSIVAAKPDVSQEPPPRGLIHEPAQVFIDRRIETHTEHRILAAPEVRTQIERREIMIETIRPSQTESVSVPHSEEVASDASIRLSKPQEERVQKRAIFEPKETLKPPISAKAVAASTFQTQPKALESTAPVVEAPTIQVNIGRIEVRATPAPPKPARPRPARPNLSLEEYLRSRSGGRS